MSDQELATEFVSVHRCSLSGWGVTIDHDPPFRANERYRFNAYLRLPLDMTFRGRGADFGDYHYVGRSEVSFADAFANLQPCMDYRKEPVEPETQAAVDAYLSSAEFGGTLAALVARYQAAMSVNVSAMIIPNKVTK